MSNQANRSPEDHIWDYIRTRWNAHAEVVSSTLNRIINYLFALNTGGLLASLTYIASRDATGKVYFSIVCFAVGILLITLHGAWSYYGAVLQFDDFKQSVDLYQRGSISGEDLTHRRRDNRLGDFFAHFLGWLSGLLFFLGLIVGICAI